MGGALQPGSHPEELVLKPFCLGSIFFHQPSILTASSSALSASSPDAQPPRGSQRKKC